MGTHIAVRIDHSYLSRIRFDKEFGNILYFAGTAVGDSDYKRNVVKVIGEYSGIGSLPIFCHKGIVWSPKTGTRGKPSSKEWYSVADRNFSILQVSLDDSSVLRNNKYVGTAVAYAIELSLKRKQATLQEPPCIQGCGQAVQLLRSYSSTDIGMLVLEKGTSWFVGEQEVPTWSTASQASPLVRASVLELILALNRKVPVNFYANPLQRLVDEHF